MLDWLNFICPIPRTAHPAQMPAGWHRAMRIIYDHELLLVTRGDVRAEIDGTSYLCHEPSFLIVPPGKPHTFDVVSPRYGRLDWVRFDWVYHRGRREVPDSTYLPEQPKERLYRLAPKFVPRGVIHGPILAPQRVTALHGRLCHLLNHGSEHDRVVCRSVMLELIIELLDNSGRSPRPGHGSAPLAEDVRAMLDSIATEPADDVPSMRSLLEQLGYSYAHLCRLFRRTYGVPPLTYLNTLRIAKARGILRNTSLSVADVARRVGLGNPAYFSRLFRKLTGTSPSRFAKAEEDELRRGGFPRSSETMSE